MIDHDRGTFSASWQKWTPKAPFCAVTTDMKGQYAALLKPHTLERLLFTKRLHGPLLNSFEGDVYIGGFLNKPLERVEGPKDIETY